MKVVFVISRLPWYQLFAPVIDAGLARGWHVECWHDYSQPEDGAKGYQFPDIAAAPALQYGAPVARAFRSRLELGEWLADDSIDAVVSIRSSQLPRPAGADRPWRSVYVELQHITDTFVGQSPDELLSCDLVAMYSEWWQRWALDYYQAQGLVTETEALERDLSARAALVGLPELDAIARVDRVEVRRKWGIPPDRPVVVYFPFPQGVGREAFWPRKIYGEPSTVRQLANVLVHRQFRYLRDVWHGWDDVHVVAAIRRFCDRNGAFLLVKSRRKTPIPSHLQAAADHCVYDEGAYPATIVEALSVASLSLSHFSSSVLESVALGVPHICVPFSAEDYAIKGEAEWNAFGRFFRTDEGGAFQFRGVSSVLNVSDLLAHFPSMHLSDFAMNVAARERYVRQFLTHSDGNGGGRLADAIEKTVQARSVTGAVGIQ